MEIDRTVCSCLFVLLASVDCSSGDDEPPPPVPSGSSTLTGTVARSAPVASGNDGKGTLVVGALESCVLTAKLLGAAILQNADLSGDIAGIPFSIANLPRGKVHLAAFLDDDGNLDLKAPRPGPGDLVYGRGAGDGVLDCVEVDLTGGDRDGVSVDLNLVEE